MEEKRVTSIKVYPDVWKKVRIHCIEKDLDISDYLDSLIRKDLKLKE